MYTRGRVAHAGPKSLINICFSDITSWLNTDPLLYITTNSTAADFRRIIDHQICAYLRVVSPHTHTFPARGHHAHAHARAS